VAWRGVAWRGAWPYLGEHVGLRRGRERGRVGRRRIKSGSRANIQVELNRVARPGRRRQQRVCTGAHRCTTSAPSGRVVKREAAWRGVAWRGVGTGSDRLS
jgi:hypothetical protein